MTTFTSLADITGTGAVVNLGTLARAAGLATQGKWAQVQADGANGAIVRIGGTEVTSSHGYPILKGTAFIAYPNGADPTDYANLDMMNVYIASNDKVYVIVGG